MGARNGKPTLERFDLRPLLAQYAGEVLLDSSEPYPVKHLDKPHWDIHERIIGTVRRAESGEDVRDEVTASELYGLVQWCLPTASEDLVASLSAQVCGAVLSIAARMVRRVEEAAPNAEGPARADVPSPA